MSEPSFAAVEAVAVILREYGSAAIEERETGVPIYEGDFAQRILALPHIHKDWEAPLRELAQTWLEAGVDDSSVSGRADTEDACARELLALLTPEVTK